MQVMSPQPEVAVEVQRLIGASLITQQQPRGKKKDKDEGSSRASSTTTSSSRAYRNGYPVAICNCCGGLQTHLANYAWTGIPLITMAGGTGRYKTKTGKETPPASSSPPVDDLLALSKLALHAQGAPLIIPGSSDNDPGKTKMGGNFYYPGGGMYVPNHAWSDTAYSPGGFGAAREDVASISGDSDVKSEPDLARHSPAQPSDSVSITSEDSSGTSENSLPRIIKPRKRRKKDRRADASDVAPGGVVVTLKPYQPLCYRYPDVSDCWSANDDDDAVGQASSSPPVYPYPPSPMCRCCLCTLPSSLLTPPSSPVGSPGPAEPPRRPRSKSSSACQVSTRIVATPYGSRDLEIKFLALSSDDDSDVLDVDKSSPTIPRTRHHHHHRHHHHRYSPSTFSLPSSSAFDDSINPYHQQHSSPTKPSGLNFGVWSRPPGTGLDWPTSLSGDQQNVNSSHPPQRPWIPLCHPDRSRPTCIFTVMCYNVLCDKYATRQLYGYCPNWALAWEYRRKGIMDEIHHYSADIISLQEVETDQFYGFFLPELKRDGYDGIFSPKSRAKTMSESDKKHVDGCAIFYRTSKFVLVKEHLVEFNQLAMANAEGSDDMLNRVMTKDNIGLAALLKTKEGVFENGMPHDQSLVHQPLLVCTAHIHWDPEFCDVKLIQTMMLMQELRSIVEEAAHSFRPSSHKLDFNSIPLLLCADLNSLPESGVIEFLSMGRISADHPDFKDLGYKECLRKLSSSGKLNEFTHPFKISTAYSDAIMPYTNYTFDFKGIIDYIFYSRQHMSVLGVLGPLDTDWLRQNKVAGCPHPHVPSDHFPLLVELQMPLPVPSPSILPNGLMLRR